MTADASVRDHAALDATATRACQGRLVRRARIRLTQLRGHGQLPGCGPLLTPPALPGLAPASRCRRPLPGRRLGLERRQGDRRRCAARSSAQCPCAAFDGSTPEHAKHGAFVKCATARHRRRDRRHAAARALHAPRASAGARSQRIYTQGGVRLRGDGAARHVLRGEAGERQDEGRPRRRPHAASTRPAAGDPPRVLRRRRSRPTRAASTRRTSARRSVVQETVNIPSAAEPADTPGSPGVVVTNPKLLTQFGGGSFSLNNARYTRHHLAGPAAQPDAILILVPGFEGGAGNFKILAENLITRAQADGLVARGVGVRPAHEPARGPRRPRHRRGVREPRDRARLALRRRARRCTLHPVLAAGPNRRAVFYNTQDDVPFIANWTNLVFSRDIDAVVDAARAAARNQNVFLGGHSAGTGFTARYAATDFNLTRRRPGRSRATRSSAASCCSRAAAARRAARRSRADTLDRIEAKFDGGLFGAVRDNAPRCVDGTTPCTIATEAVDCVGQVPPKCTLPTTAYAVVAGLLNPRILAAGEVTAIQAIVDPDGTRDILRVDQGAPGQQRDRHGARPRHARRCSPHVDGARRPRQLRRRRRRRRGARVLRRDLGRRRPAPTVGGLLSTWQDITRGPVRRRRSLPNNGPPPTTLPGARVGPGEGGHAHRSHRGRPSTSAATNFTDWYYPSCRASSVTSASGVCTARHLHGRQRRRRCTTDGAVRAVDQPRLDGALGRPRPARHREPDAGGEHRHPGDRVRRHERPRAGARHLHRVRRSIGACTAPSCDGTPRVVDADAAEPRVPDLRRRRRRLRGRASPRASRTSTC